LKSDITSTSKNTIPQASPSLNHIEYCRIGCFIVTISTLRFYSFPVIIHPVYIKGVNLSVKNAFSVGLAVKCKVVSLSLRSKKGVANVLWNDTARRRASGERS
jgi:hypothetical protein